MSIFNLSKLASDSTHFRVLAETGTFCVGHEFEYAYLIDKRKKQEIFLGDFYGDPSCAVISINNDWCAVGGEHLVVWIKEKGIIILEGYYPQWILELKQRSDQELEILVESEHGISDVWLMSILTLERTKIASNI